MQKYRLFTPGPTPVPERVRFAIAQDVLHHRTPHFESILEELRGLLKKLFQTEQDVLCLSGSGTLAMDAAVCNVLSPGDEAIVVVGGKFGERWVELLQTYQCKPIVIDVALGHAVNPNDVLQKLNEHPQAKAVYLQACETSTGVVHPHRAIARLCQNHSHALCIVDAITAVGVYDIAMDRDEIDVLITGSQKALMLPPGLCMIALSEKAWRCAQTSTLPKYYMDLTREKKAWIKNQTAYTSSVALLRGLLESLRMIFEEGLPAVFERHAALAFQTREGLLDLGCTLFAQAPAQGVTAACPPAGVDATALMRDVQKRYNMTLGGGQDALLGRIFRVAHMGYYDVSDIDAVIAAIASSLRQLRG